MRLHREDQKLSGRGTVIATARCWWSLDLGWFASACAQAQHARCLLPLQGG